MFTSGSGLSRRGCGGSRFLATLGALPGGAAGLARLFQLGGGGTGLLVLMVVLAGRLLVLMLLLLLLLGCHGGDRPATRGSLLLLLLLLATGGRSTRGGTTRILIIQGYGLFRITVSHKTVTFVEISRTNFSVSTKEYFTQIFFSFFVLYVKGTH